MKTSPTRIALWQDHSPAGDIAAAFARLEPALRAAAAMGAVTLVAPELYLPGYNQDPQGQARGGPWHQRLAELCAETGCGLVLGYAEAGTFNAAVAFDATGAEIAHYRKVQLYGPREARLFTPGDTWAIFDLDGIKAALMICYDVEFAPHVAALAAEGVQLLLVPTANMEPFSHVARVTVPAMAANHGLHIVYANYCGSEGDLDYTGLSLIAGPHGEVLAQAGQTPTLLVADLATPDPARLSTQARDLRVIR